MKKIAVIQDMSGLGKCSLTAAIPVISAMGVQACPLPTAILSNQTGYDSYFYDDYTGHMDEFIKEWKKQNFVPDGIYTGFIASEHQVDNILRFIQEFAVERTQILVDPVMGDNGSVYKTYSHSLCEKMKALVHRADVITPNLTEALVLLNGAKNIENEYEAIRGIEDAQEFEEKVKNIGCRLKEVYELELVVITGVENAKKKSMIANLVISKDDDTLVPSKKYTGSYSGTGDLFASVLSAGMVLGRHPVETVKKAVRFLEPAIRDAVEEGTDPNDGVCFETYLHYLWEV